jgi:hypothetical protein
MPAMPFTQHEGCQGLLAAIREVLSLHVLPAKACLDLGRGDGAGTSMSKTPSFINTPKASTAETPLQIPSNNHKRVTANRGLWVWEKGSNNESKQMDSMEGHYNSWPGTVRAINRLGTLRTSLWPCDRKFEVGKCLAFNASLLNSLKFTLKFTLSKWNEFFKTH